MLNKFGTMGGLKQVTLTVTVNEALSDRLTWLLLRFAKVVLSWMPELVPDDGVPFEFWMRIRIIRYTSVTSLHFSYILTAMTWQKLVKFRVQIRCFFFCAILFSLPVGYAASTRPTICHRHFVSCQLLSACRVDKAHQQPQKEKARERTVVTVGEAPI